MAFCFEVAEDVEERKQRVRSGEVLYMQGAIVLSLILEKR